jgi:hypothetical protein
VQSVFCDMRLRHWVIDWCCVRQGFKVHKEMDLGSLENEDDVFLEVSGTTYTVTQETRVNSLLNS